MKTPVFITLFFISHVPFAVYLLGPPWTPTKSSNADIVFEVQGLRNQLESLAECQEQLDQRFRSQVVSVNRAPVEPGPKSLEKRLVDLDERLSLLMLELSEAKPAGPTMVPVSAVMRRNAMELTDEMFAWGIGRVHATYGRPDLVRRAGQNVEWIYRGSGEEDLVVVFCDGFVAQAAKRTREVRGIPQDLEADLRAHVGR